MIASLIGEGKLDTARKGFSFLLLSCVAGSTLLAALALLFLHQLVRFLGADAGLLPLCEDYIIPLIISGPFIMGGIILDGS